MTPDKLIRRALAEGAEVEIDGRLVNAARQKIRAVPKVETPAPAPVPVKPAPPALTRQDVQDMLAAQEARWKQAFDQLRAEIRTPKPAPKSKPVKKVVKFTYEGDAVKGFEITDKE